MEPSPILLKTDKQESLRLGPPTLGALSSPTTHAGLLIFCLYKIISGEHLFNQGINVHSIASVRFTTGCRKSCHVCETLVSLVWEKK